MSKRQEDILMDTNVIIEAHRTGCWKPLTTDYRLATVQKCVAETQKGNKSAAGYASVPMANIEGKVAVHKVTPEMRVTAALGIPGLDALDAGEKELVSFAYSQAAAFLLCSPDGAVVRISHTLGWDQRLIPLETLTDGINLKPKLARNFTKKWLSQFQTQLKLGVLR